MLRDNIILQSIAGLFILGLCSAVSAVERIEVKGLFSGSAVLLIDGKQRLLKKGKTSPEGVRLLEADSRQATVEVDGKQQTLRLSRRVGAEYSEPKYAEVRLPSGDFGHYVTSGRINASSVQFMVDTGASVIAISSQGASALGLSFRDGAPVQVATANGMVAGFQITLNSVSVGNLTLNNVTAVVIEGDSPNTILLGNSFLSRVNMRVEEGVLILQSRY
ncbi:aspartyl protease family protein [Alteromonadaceae bacterium Bs31]|nr:aspartyl protease family protein [Alteromonadaceae bacterium Bs31]